MAADLPGTLTRVAGIGYSAVEPYNFVATADQLRDAFEANGLSAPSGHAPLLREDQDEIFAAAATLGIGTVIDPFVAPELWTSVDAIRATADKLNAAAARGAGHGIRVGYHNHWFELESTFDGKFGLEVLADHLDPAVVLEVDTYWAQVGGADPAALLRSLGDRVKFIHIKDGPATKEPGDQVAVGSGTLPIWDIIEAAGSIDAGVVELDDFAGDMFTAVTDSLNFLEGGK
nr:sugar phosphate isomerase/epimerase [Spelaeicoccus albus]